MLKFAENQMKKILLYCGSTRWSNGTGEIPIHTSIQGTESEESRPNRCESQGHSPRFSMPNLRTPASVPPPDTIRVLCSSSVPLSAFSSLVLRLSPSSTLRSWDFSCPPVDCERTSPVIRWYTRARRFLSVHSGGRICRDQKKDNAV
jgi:hypothetical protein